MASWATSDRHGDGQRRGTSPTRDSNRHRDPSLPQWRPEEVPRYVNPIFWREDTPGTTGQNLEYEVGPRLSARPQEISAVFARTVPFNSLRASRDFIQSHPEILQEPNLDRKYRDPAVQNLAAGDDESRKLALSYMEKYAIIRITKSYQSDRRDFLSLLLSDNNDAKETFRAVFARVKADWEEKARSTNLRSSVQHPADRAQDEAVTRMRQLDITRNTESIRRGSDAQEAPYRTSGQLLERDHHSASTTAPPPGRDRSTGRHDQGSDAPDPDVFDNEHSHGATTPRPVAPMGPISDTRFRKLEPREWRYFRAGRVFAIKTYNEHNSQPDEEKDDFSIEGAKTARGSEVVYKCRRMLVVKARSGFCLAVPINTYGGQGLKKLGLRQNNIDAHARIHMSHRLPTWLDGEPRTGKHDIKVEPEDRQQDLHPASRVCFERTHSVDYNEKIWKIGTVTDPACLARLAQYWDNENSRDSSHGRARGRSSADQTGRQEKNRQGDARAERHRGGDQRRGNRR